MVKKFEEYQHAYEEFAYLRREDGILEIRLHTDGGSAVFDAVMHARCSDLFRDIAQDMETRVVIYTGTGDRFMDPPDVSVMESLLPYTSAMHTTIIGESVRVLSTFLDIEVPVISAVNGPAPSHAELVFLSDIAIASDDAYFSEFHFRSGLVPGDGTHIVWPSALGPQRAQYYLLTGKRIEARQAMEFGFVQEVHPKADLLTRAWELARELNEQNPVTLRLTRMLYTQPFKREVQQSLLLGVALEGLGSINHWPTKLVSE